MNVFKKIAAHILRQEVSVVSGIISSMYSLQSQFVGDMIQAISWGVAISARRRYFSDAHERSFNVTGQPLPEGQGVDGTAMTLYIQCPDATVASMTIKALRRQHSNLVVQIIVDGPTRFRCIVGAASPNLYAAYHAAVRSPMLAH